MIASFLYLAIAAFQFALVSDEEKAKAEVALRAAISAIDVRNVTVDWLPNSLYRVNEPYDKISLYKTVRELDSRKLVGFEIKKCYVNRRWTKCAELAFDRGLGDGGVTVLEVAIRKGKLRTAADVKAISITQFIAPRD